jgi:hypothetical protein
MDISHHAHLVAGEREAVLPDILSAAEKLMGVTPMSSPDFWLGEFETFGIGESRMLREMASTVSVSGGKRVFVVCANFFTVEAQNALLKTIEEPPADTHFFFLVSELRRIIPTLLSRFEVIAENSFEGGRGSAQSAENFLANRTKARLDIVQKLVAGYDEPETRGEAKRRIAQFLSDLEIALSRRRRDISASDFVFSCSQITLAKKYLGDVASAPRLLAEHIALVLPIIK